ncbi:MAG: oligosaccharide flippase family protein [Alphaproteobacteria bacterium]
MIIRHTVIYGAARFIPGLASLGLIAFVTRFLSPEDVGVYFLITATVLLAHGLTMVWFNMSVARFLQRSADQTELLGNTLSLFGLVLILATLAVMVAWAVIDDPLQRRFLLLGFAFYAALSWFELVCQVMAARLEASRRLIYGVVRSLTASGLGAGLAWFGFGVEGLVVGAMIGALVPGAYAYVLDWRSVAVRWNPSVIVEFCRFGLPLALSFSMGAVSYATDRFMVAAMENVAVLGLYVVGFELAQRVMMSVIQPVGAAALPLVIETFEKRGAEAARTQLETNCLLLLAVTSPALVGLVLVTPDFVQVAVGEEFRDMAIMVLPVIAVAQFVLGIQHHFIDHSFHLGMKTGWHAIIGSVVVVTNLIANYLLIQVYGAVGAAYGTLIAAVVGVGLGAFLSRFSFRLPVPWGAIAGLVIANAAMAGAVILVDLPPSFLGLVVKGIMGALVYGVAVLTFNTLNVRTVILERARLILARRRADAASSAS